MYISRTHTFIINLTQLFAYIRRGWPAHTYIHLPRFATHIRQRAFHFPQPTFCIHHSTPSSVPKAQNVWSRLFFVPGYICGGCGVVGRCCTLCMCGVYLFWAIYTPHEIPRGYLLKNRNTFEVLIADAPQRVSLAVCLCAHHLPFHYKCLFRFSVVFIRFILAGELGTNMAKTTHICLSLSVCAAPNIAQNFEIIHPKNKPISRTIAPHAESFSISFNLMQNCCSQKCTHNSTGVCYMKSFDSIQASWPARIVPVIWPTPRRASPSARLPPS